MSVLLGIVLWPWGPIAVVYLAWRLHLNKFMVLAAVVLCIPRALPALCIRVGQYVLQSDVRPRIVWFVGSHIVAFPAALATALLVYAGARGFRSRPWTHWGKS
jgi:hypothetical protein